MTAASMVARPTSACKAKSSGVTLRLMLMVLFAQFGQSICGT
jgi:hypothetical protein